MSTHGQHQELLDSPFPETVATQAIQQFQDDVQEFREKEKKKKKKKEVEAQVEKEAKPKRVGSDRGIETMFRTSYRTHVDMSALADTKANIMISINGLIISIILASISPKIDSNPWLMIPTSVLLVSCLISITYAILAARPRVSKNTLTLDKVREGANILFFGNFVTLSEAEFQEGMEELMQEPQRLYANMVRDIYGLGRVLSRKFALLRVAYTVFMFGLIVSVLLYLAVYASVVASPETGSMLF